jgi:hypothetical protein
MKEKSARKRFSKPYNFLNKKGEKELASLIEVFQHFHLDEFREEINLWKDLALCDNDNAYGEGEEREDLIDFIHELHKLTEALHIINCRQQKHDQKGLSKDMKKILSQTNRIMALSGMESEKPEEVIKRFCKTFTLSYVKSELLDLLDAVITYYGPKSVNMINLVLFYRHLLHLAKISYNISKGKLNYQ